MDGHDPRPRDWRGHFKKKAIPTSARRDIAMRHGCKPGDFGHAASCHYCGSVGTITWWPSPRGYAGGWVSFSGLELDHVVPEYMGGANDSSNIVLACRPCNRSKGRKTLSEWRGARHG